MKGVNILYGVLMTAVFMAFATAISLSCLSKANSVSREAYAQDIALCEVQTVADLASAYQGDMGKVTSISGGSVDMGRLCIAYDINMDRTDGGSAYYMLEAGPVMQDRGLCSCLVRVYNINTDNEVFSATASWQGGLEGDDGP